MKLNVCKEITSVDLSDKTIALMQPNVSPGRYNLNFQANETSFENCSAQRYFKNPSRNPFQSSSLLAIRTFFCICCVTEMFLHYFKGVIFLYSSLNLVASFLCLKLAKIRNRVPQTLQPMRLEAKQGTNNRL